METIDGSAVEGEDYEPVNEILTFEPHEREKEVILIFAFFLQNRINHIEILKALQIYVNIIQAFFDIS